jgi:hypothetical protein
MYMFSHVLYLRNILNNIYLQCFTERLREGGREVGKGRSDDSLGKSKDEKRVSRRGGVKVKEERKEQSEG